MDTTSQQSASPSALQPTMTQQTPNLVAQQAHQQLAMMTNAASTVFPQQMPIVEPQVDWSTKITEVMREQFGLRPKQQSVMYKTPYPPAYDQIPLPHKYKMPDFTKFSGQGEVSTMEHVNRFLYSWEKRATMMHSESVCSPCLCLDRPLLGSPLCQQIPYYIGPI